MERNSLCPHESGQRKDKVMQEAIRVLVVEDDPLFIKLVSSMLMIRDCKVRGVGSAEEAVEVLKKESFKLLITDLKMEGLGGVGLIRMLLSDRSFASLRILVITGEPDGSEDSVWVTDQKIPILHKPFTLKSLLESVDSILQCNL